MQCQTSVIPERTKLSLPVFHKRKTEVTNGMKTVDEISGYQLLIQSYVVQLFLKYEHILLYFYDHILRL